MAEDVDSPAYVAARLDAMAPKLAPGATGAADLRRLTAGASLQTWSFDVVGETDCKPLILRRRTVERDENALPLATEARLIALAAKGGVPVPDLVHLCLAQEGLGEAYVVERLPGETLGRRIAADPRFAPARERLARQCGAALARIHALPPDPSLETLDARATLDRYEAIWREAGAVRPAMEAAFRWLRATAPDPVSPRLLHGDFRNGNILVDADQGLVAVLDWELAHLGDPAEDLGWLCVNSWRFGLPERPVGGFGDLSDLLAGYAEAGGHPPAPTRIRWWQAVGSLKWGVMTTMMYRSFASGDDPRPERAVIGRRLSECEGDLIALMRTAR